MWKPVINGGLTWCILGPVLFHFFSNYLGEAKDFEDDARFRLDIRKSYSLRRQSSIGEGCPDNLSIPEFMSSPSLKVYKTQLDKALRSLAQPQS